MKNRFHSLFRAVASIALVGAASAAVAGPMRSGPPPVPRSVAATVYRPPPTTQFNRATFGPKSGVKPAQLQRSYRTIDSATQRNGAAAPGFRAHGFKNDGRGGSMVLPNTNGAGKPLDYRTYYLRQQAPNGSTYRQNARIVTDPRPAARSPAYLSTHYGQNGGRVVRVQ